MQHVLESAREWLSIEEATALVERGRSTVYRWVDAGWVRSERPRRRAYFHREDLLATEAAIHSGETPSVKVQSTR